MGECLPVHLWRFDGRYPVSRQDDDKLLHLPSFYIRRDVAITTAGVCGDAALLSSLAAPGVGQKLFPVDHPFERRGQAGAWLDAAPLEGTVRAKVAHGNAERLASAVLFRSRHMRIIALEEHTVDAGIAKATEAAMAAEAGYAADVDDGVNGPTPLQDRPYLLPNHEALTRAADVGPGRIAEMDAHGIDMQVLSYSNAPQLAPSDGGAGLMRAANDRLAGIVRTQPGRFAGFAALPWQDPEAAAAELERAVHGLGFKGTLLIGRPGQTFLDDPRYEPVLAKLNELRVPIYVHPGAPLPQVQKPYYGGLDKTVTARLSLFGWGWHNEAGIQVVRMILSGVFDRFPNLQVISGHWGEMVPFYLQRMDDTMPRTITGLSRSITETYRSQVHVTPSGMLSLPHFKFIHEVLGADRILYAVDYPYLTNTGARRFLEQLPVSQDDKEKIAHRNAETLLGL